MSETGQPKTGQPAAGPSGVGPSATQLHDLRGVLAVKPFRRLWIALGLSSLGDWLGLLALTAMASQLTQGDYRAQNFAIAGVLLARVAPAAVVGPLAGYVADRLDRRWTMVIGDLLRFAIFLSIPFVGTLTWLFVATVLVEIVALLWLPAKDATVPNLVPRERLEAANQISLATTYGSALPAAGLFVGLTLYSSALSATVGVFETNPNALAVFVNAFTFLISAITIYTLKEIPPPAPRDERGGSMIKTIVEGWSFIVGTPLVRGLVVGIVGAFAAGGVVVGLARVYVSDLGAGDPGYGVLFGSVFAGLALGMWVGPRTLTGFSRRRLFGAALTAAGISLVGVAAVQNIVIVTMFTLVLGVCAGVAWVTGYTLLGLEVEDALRGRTFAAVQSLIRLTLASVLAAAPAVAGLIGEHRIEFTDDVTLTYNGAAITILIAAAVFTIVGVSSYRQMDDRPGVSLLADLRTALGGGRGERSKTGLFVAFEGGEGAGKSTQVKLLAQWLERHGLPVVTTREPGATPLGSRLRDILLDPATGVISPRTEALLYAADRAEHVDRVIRPALERSEVVITDRYVDSSLAYQGAGRGMGPRPVERLARLATGDLRPHLTVLLDVVPSVGRHRFSTSPESNGGPDRLEAEADDFHHQVRGAFLERASSDPQGYLVIDADQPVEQVAQQVRDRVAALVERQLGQVVVADESDADEPAPDADAPAPNGAQVSPGPGHR